MVARKRIYVILILLTLGALAGVLFVHSRAEAPVVRQRALGDVLVAGGIQIPITIADTDEEREQGLSGTLSLPHGTGKFFVFDESGLYGFWMKDMNYSLDLVWIDSEMRVVSISENVTPDSYPTSFYPSSAVRYVLEVNAHEAATLGLAQGVQLIKKENL